VQNGIASQDDIDKILELGQQVSCFHSAWRELMREARTLRHRLKNISKDDIEYDTEYD
jgi:hypothetical protein